MTATRRAAQVLSASCSALTEAISQHMPAGPYRDFASWAYSPRNPRRQEFLQASGLTQLASMNATVLSGLVSEQQWPVMLAEAARMNTYQIFEVISDNLGLGLGEPELDGPALQRKTLVSQVNRAMIEALQPGRQTPAVLLLAGHAQQAARHASGFTQSLAAGKHSGLAGEYAAMLEANGQPSPSVQELEFGLWPALVAGVETCRDLALSLTTATTGDLVRQGLADRYQANDRTLHARYLSRLELASLGTQTILVAPTLAFFITVLYERLNSIDGYPEIVADGTLSDVLADAALLVRLQNDVGSSLLLMSPVQQAAKLRTLTDDALGSLRASADPAFARLHKDSLNGECNVALWHPRRAAEPEAAAQALADGLSYYARLYVQHWSRLSNGLARLDERLGDKKASTLIERFVRFHERMYAQSHTASGGDYAI
jgi:hypothetical protein